MNAVNSYAGEPVADAPRNARRLYEPSMEEILASIRSIIAEERGDVFHAGGRMGLRRADAPLAKADIGSEKSLAEKAALRPGLLDEASGKTPAPRAAANEPAQPEPPASRTEDEPLMSPETEEAALAAFRTLSAGLRARSVELAEAMVRELVRPMLKAWLNENLPGLVERLVRAELNRISRSLS